MVVFSDTILLGDCINWVNWASVNDDGSDLGDVQFQILPLRQGHFFYGPNPHVGLDAEGS